MVDHIVSVDDNFEFPEPIQNMLKDLIKTQVEAIINGVPWTDLALSGTWTHGSTKGAYRLGGTPGNLYLELRGIIKSGGTSAIGTFPNLPVGSIPSLKLVYARTVNNGNNLAIRITQSGLEVTSPPTSGVDVNLDGIRVYL